MRFPLQWVIMGQGQPYIQRGGNCLPRVSVVVKNVLGIKRWASTAKNFGQKNWAQETLTQKALKKSQEKRRTETSTLRRMAFGER